MALPPEIVRILGACLVQNETPSNSTLLLMALCGVCRRWREFGREAPAGLALHFDGSQDTQHGPKSTLAQFRRAPIAHKRDLLEGASRLLTGYSELTLSGEAINDQMLLNVAVANGWPLKSIKLQGTPHVTDAGLCTLISAAPNLRQFSIEDAGPGVVGHFVPALLQHCLQLEALMIDGAESMDWAALRSSGAWTAAMATATARINCDSSISVNSRGVSSLPPLDLLRQAAPAGIAQATQQQQQQHVTQSADPAQCLAAAAGPQQPERVERSAAGSAGNSSSSGSRRASLPLQRSSSPAGPGSSRQLQMRADLRSWLNSISSMLGSEDGSSGPEDGSGSDDGSRGSSMGAGSDSTSISMPPHAVEALSQQLQRVLPGPDTPGPAASSAAAAAAGVTAAASSSSSSAHPRAALQAAYDASRARGGSRNRQQLRWQDARPCHPALKRLRVRGANIDTLQQLLECVPFLSELQIDGSAQSMRAAAALCPWLRRVAYLVSSPYELDAALRCLGRMRDLRALELEVKGMVLSTEQLRAIGMLPLRELCLDSYAYRQHPSMPRPQYSHLDNDGVKGLVDSICSRMRTELMPLKLSLCGATALKQEAVSALLRLPILASIDTGGCVKLTPMDRMRLVAKVKAGQGLLDKAGTGAVGLAGLRLPHIL